MLLKRARIVPFKRTGYGVSRIAFVKDFLIRSILKMFLGDRRFWGLVVRKI